MPFRAAWPKPVVFILAAGACFLAAAAGHLYRHAGPLLKIKPWDFAREQESLRTLSLQEVDRAREKAETEGITIEEALDRTLAECRTEEEKRLAAAPLDEYIARAAGDRMTEVSGPDWESFLDRVQAAVRSKDLPRDWAHRVTADDLAFGRFESLFFRHAERPLHLLDALTPGQAFYLKLPSIPPQYFEIYALGTDENQGRESGRHDAAVLWKRPPAFAFPYRRFEAWPLLAGVGLLLVPLIGHYAAFLRRAGRPAFRNPDKRAAAAWTGVAVAAAVGMFLPFWAGIDPMNGGFAAATVALFVLILGVVAAVIYARRGARLERLVSGENLIAHWTYTPEEWRGYVEADYAAEKEEKTALFKLVVVIALVVGLGFLLFTRDEAGLITFGVILCVIVLLAFVAFAVPRMKRRRQIRSGAEAYLSLTGAYVGGIYHDWAMLGASLEGAGIEDDPAPMVVVQYGAPTRAGIQTYTLRVPIPAGKRAEAEGWVARLAEWSPETLGH